jgi:hypothetical protein
VRLTTIGRKRRIKRGQKIYYPTQRREREKGKDLITIK